MKRPIVMKLHISKHHYMVSAVAVSFAGQGLTLTYFLCSVEHNQIYALLNITKFTVKILNIGTCMSEQKV